jgi:hypothetical protein
MRRVPGPEVAYGAGADTPGVGPSSRSRPYCVARHDTWQDSFDLQISADEKVLRAILIYVFLIAVLRLVGSVTSGRRTRSTSSSCSSWPTRSRGRLQLGRRDARAAPIMRQSDRFCAPVTTRAERPRGEKPPIGGIFEEAHTGFEPVLPPNAGGKPDSASASDIAPGSEPNPHLRAVLERLKARDRERGR